MVEQENLMARISRAGARIDPGLTEREVERLIRRAAERRVQRRLQRRALLAAGAAVGAVLLVAGAVRWRGESVPPPAPMVAQGTKPVVPAAAPAAPPAESASRVLRLADGSTATPAGADASLTVHEDSPARVSIDLARGRGRFDVVPNHARAFEVRAGEVSVHVVGTVFSVERVADRVGVTVERGVVRVDWGVGMQQLTAGQNGWFPPLQVQAAVPALATTSARPAHSAEELLRTADAERLAGHPEEGARLLQRLLREHRGDPRAPLGALTLGRLLMIEMAKPRQAAAAFADARALAPHGPFAEDALAREVEAWSKAGDAVTATKRARLYLARYPNGHRADTVKAFGGVE